jgi:hypothetical protein
VYACIEEPDQNRAKVGLSDAAIKAAIAEYRDGFNDDDDDDA